MLVSGGTGSGKTTLLNALSAFIPGRRARHHHRGRGRAALAAAATSAGWKPGPTTSKGVGEVTTRDLVRNALRMRPDRIIIGECRGPEALDMLQAMNTGHEGSLTTVHANDTREALGRLEMMVGMAGFDLPHVGDPPADRLGHPRGRAGQPACSAASARSSRFPR